ncbi:MAG: sigma-70 family RNA polymerase sigma factor [Actinomycetes bacterium]
MDVESVVGPGGDPDLDDPGAPTDLVRVYLDAIGRTALLNAAEEVDLAQRIEAGLYAAEKLRRDEAVGALPAALAAELAVLVDDGARARDLMLQANLRLVVSVAKKHTGRGLPFLDLVQEGNVGLVRAVEKFDFRRGFKFSTYAMWWIRQAIQRALADQSRTIRLPVHVSEELGRVTRAKRRLGQDLGREPTAEEIASSTGSTAQRVGDLSRLSRVAASLDTPVGSAGETPFGDLLEDVDAPVVADVVERGMLARGLAARVDRLPPQERSVIMLRYGLAQGRPHTLAEIGRILDIPRDRVRRIERAALERLRDEHDRDEGERIEGERIEGERTEGERTEGDRGDVLGDTG